MDDIDYSTFFIAYIRCLAVVASKDLWILELIGASGYVVPIRVLVRLWVAKKAEVLGALDKSPVTHLLDIPTPLQLIQSRRR